MTAPDGGKGPTGFRHWPGDVEADYVYTSGVAGDAFLKTLRDEGRLTAPKCDTCGDAWLPPRLFCESCFLPMTTWIDVGDDATVETYTVAHEGVDGTLLSTPEVWAVLRFPDVRGGLVHRVDGSPDSVTEGMAVRPVLRPKEERRGSITDILHFAPRP
jgi:uncharacterized OB-fold protein